MDKSQNIYDNKTFFESYLALRERDDNHNVLIEQPAMAARLPDVTGARVLDLGCGFGANCLDFVRLGADYVLGVDISERMLGVARTEAASPRIEYRCMDMRELSKIEGQFDLIYSSLAFHYIEDIAALFAEIRAHLRPNGVLLFSQEHPLNTTEGFFNRNDEGDRISYTLFDYNVSGKRVTTWFVDGVEKYHRPMGELLTALARAGLIIEEVYEPIAEDWALAKRPALAKERIKPCFLIVRARA